MNTRKQQALTFFSNVIEGLGEKYTDFKDSLDCYDTEVFVIIPMILLLKRIEENDHGICEDFLPDLQDVTSPNYQHFQTFKQ